MYKCCDQAQLRSRLNYPYTLLHNFYSINTLLGILGDYIPSKKKQKNMMTKGFSQRVYTSCGTVCCLCCYITSNYINIKQQASTRTSTIYSYIPRGRNDTMLNFITSTSDHIPNVFIYEDMDLHEQTLLLSSEPRGVKCSESFNISILTSTA